MKGITFYTFSDPFVYDDPRYDADELFGYVKKSTWKDWGLVLKERPDISFPETKTHYIDLSGANGMIDMTTSLTGEPKYNNRVGSLTFVKAGGRERWDVLKSKIANFLHGKKRCMIIDDDRSFYYVGRFFLNEWTSNQKIGELVIDYNLEPYKYELWSSIDQWRWDPFNFETGVIRNYNEIEIVPEMWFYIRPVTKPCVPVITVDTQDGQGFHVLGAYGTQGIQQWFDLPDGTYKDPNFIIRRDIYNQYYFKTGTGKITIDFRDGSL